MSLFKRRKLGAKPDADFNPAEKLADLEAEQVKNHKQQIKDVEKNLLQALIDNDITIMEWFAIVKHVNRFHDSVVPFMSFKEVEKYDGRNKAN